MHNRVERHRPILPGLITVVLAGCWLSWSGLGSLASAQPAGNPPAVRFIVESQAGLDMARQCDQIWSAEGPRLAAALMPAGVIPDTVACLLLGTSSFQERFGTTIPDWGVGLALPSGRAVALDFGRIGVVGRGLREVFLHEMTHALLFQSTADTWLPTWFHEGVALRFSGEWRFLDTVSLALDGYVPTLQRLQGRFSGSVVQADRAYRTSLLAVSRLEDLYGPQIIGDLVESTAALGDFGAAFVEVTGEPLDGFQKDFDRTMRLRYGWVFILTRWPVLFVLMSLAFALGAVRKIILTRRRLNDLPDDDSSDDDTHYTS